MCRAIDHLVGHLVPVFFTLGDEVVANARGKRWHRNNINNNISYSIIVYLISMAAKLMDYTKHTVQ